MWRMHEAATKRLWKGRKWGIGEENQNLMHHQNRSEFTTVPSRTLQPGVKTASHPEMGGRDTWTGLQESSLVLAKEQESGTNGGYSGGGRGAGLSLSPLWSLVPQSAAVLSTQESKRGCGKKKNCSPKMSMC